MYLENYLEALRLLADADAQLKYEQTVPVANVPAELVCLWFDDLDTQNLPADLSPSAATLIRAFSAYYGSRLENLPTHEGVANLQMSAAWQDVMAEAQKTLDHLGQGTTNTPMRPDRASLDR